MWHSQTHQFQEKYDCYSDTCWPALLDTVCTFPFKVEKSRAESTIWADWSTCKPHSSGEGEQRSHTYVCVLLSLVRLSPLWHSSSTVGEPGPQNVQPRSPFFVFVTRLTNRFWFFFFLNCNVKKKDRNPASTKYENFNIDLEQIDGQFIYPAVRSSQL